MAVKMKAMLGVAVWSLLAVWMQPLAAHGLHMTTAEVIQRHDNHLSITVRTSVSALFKRMEYSGKPTSLIHLASGSDQNIRRFREALMALFQAKMTVSVMHKPLQSLKVRTLSEEALRKLIQDEVAEHILGTTANDQHETDRRNYLRVDLDGFIAETKADPKLEAYFPKELGQILVSYSKPQMQTITPGAEGSRYSQALQ